MNPLFRTLFSKEIRAYEQAVIKSRDDATREIREMQNAADRKVGLYEMMKQAFAVFPDWKIIGIEKNKNGSNLFVFEQIYGNNGLDICLYGMAYNAHNIHPKVLGSFHKCKNNSSKQFLFIDDINEIDKNCGNGSILLTYLIREAKELHMESIRGELSYVDIARFDRIEHFYSKHGFTVTLNEAKDGAIIKLVL